jgi:predicted NAD/FAD-binding protein
MKIAIVGSGISGLAAAHRLRGVAALTLFEAGDYFGGHSNTVSVTLPSPQGLLTHGVDTGFLVFNERTYPHLVALFAELGVQSSKSDMSFSVQVPGAHTVGSVGGTLEWSGSSLDTVFAQRGNLASPGFLRMLRDVLRFNRLATGIALQSKDPAPSQSMSASMRQSVADFLVEHRFCAAFRDWYLLPMLGCIWSCPTTQMLQFPVATMVRFCHNHGLLQVRNRPQWWTVTGGARNYVEKMVAPIVDKRLNAAVEHITRDAQGVWIRAQGQTQRFDAVVLATHSDQSLQLLGDASAQERAVLGAIAYQSNRAVLHTDTSVLPQQRKAWAAWNYQRAQPSRTNEGGDMQANRVCLHYWLNRLQPLPFAQSVVVSLNPLQAIAPAHTIGSYDYAHPVFDLAALRAQAQVPALQGQGNTFFCGAWTGYGFHEDGLKSGLQVAGLVQQAYALGPAVAA